MQARIQQFKQYWNQLALAHAWPKSRSSIFINGFILPIASRIATIITV